MKTVPELEANVSSIPRTEDGVTGPKPFVLRSRSHFQCSPDKNLGILIVLDLQEAPRGKV